MTSDRRAIVVVTLVLAVVAGHFAVRTMQLARHSPHADFAAVYTAAHLFRDGVDFYDPGLVRENGRNTNPAVRAAAARLGTLHAHGELTHVHEFSYPPAAVLLFVPLTALPFRAAAVTWQALSLAFLALAVACLWRAVPLSTLAGLTLVTLIMMSEPFDNSLGLGQINLLVLALVAVFLAALRGDAPVVAGVALGVAAGLRLHPVVFLPYLIWRRAWGALVAAALTAAAVTGAGVLFVGWPATVEYLTQVAPKYGFARLPLWLGNHSLGGFVVATGHALLPSVSPGFWRALALAASLVLLAAAFVALGRRGPVGGDRLIAEIAFLSGVLLLVTPNTTINHLVFAVLPLALVLGGSLETGDVVATTVLAAALLCIGAIDDYYAHPSLARGPAVLLAGIKTYGLAALTLLAWRRMRLAKGAA